ncbi:TPA: hypothetical protein N0F65_000277 [Lagenidium giganteum]|uniref:Uncharacterized protein n=1 Tax=Lagenidium giganteum TaxID=4803 RepID=A0AAV2ZBQ2_9STRA|nr:TPA: hypothetical protein N0F65_000277 [Lagenidium giganteum]
MVTYISAKANLYARFLKSLAIWTHIQSAILWRQINVSQLQQMMMFWTIVSIIGLLRCILGRAHVQVSLTH